MPRHSQDTTRPPCLDCGASLEGSHHNTKRCAPCSRRHTLERQRRWTRKQSGRTEDRKCLTCGANLEGQAPARRRCVECAEAYSKASRKAYHYEWNKKHGSAYRKRPDQKARIDAYMAEYKNRPENKERARKLALIARRKRLGMPPVRVCLDCWKCLEGKPPAQKRCTECYAIYKRRWARKYWAIPENRARKVARKMARKPWDDTVTSESIAAMLEDQGGMCNLCGCDIRSGYQKDHIMPHKLGGESTLANLQLLCQSCNASKQDKPPTDFRQSMKLTKLPRIQSARTAHDSRPIPTP